jgi:hypothetical protein
MGKRRGPRKPRDSAPKQPPIDDQPIEPLAQEKAHLVPPARRPPSVVGAETRPLPRERSALGELLEVVRAAVVSLLDLADATVEAITKRVAG